MSTHTNDNPTIASNNMLVGLSGSIGAYYFANLLVALKAQIGASLRVIQTPSAVRMVNSDYIRITLGCDVWTDPYDQVAGIQVPHSQLPEWADVFVVMPATAHTLASAAHGYGDSLLSLAIMASPIPVGFVPNMGERMWNAPSTQRNVRQLREDGHLVLDQGGQDSSTVAYSAGTQSFFESAAANPQTIANFLIELLQHVRRSGSGSEEQS